MIELETKIRNMGAYEIHFRDCFSKEKDGEHGLSHLVEHCMCEQVKKFENKMKEYSVSWNAYTTSDEIVFFISGLDKYIKKFINKFTEAVLEYEITPEVFERERNIVIAEYKQSFNEEFERFYINFHRKHYNYTGVVGSLGDLENITYEKFMKFKNRIIKDVSVIYYMHPKTKKKFELEKKIKETELEKKNLDLTFKEEGYDKYKMEYFNSGISEERNLMIFNRFTYNNKEEKYKTLALAKVLINYLTNGLTSYLYQEIREKLACVYSIHGSQNVFEKESNVEFYLSTSDDNEEKVIKKINSSLGKLMKRLNKRKFNTAIKNITTNTQIQDSLNWSSPELIVDEQYNAIKTLFKEKKITFEDFTKFVEQFVSGYKIYSDKDYLKD